MSSSNIDNLQVNTKLKAYKLVHDPTVLLSLLYSKYGDIAEDFNLFHINQLIYETSSHYNIAFLEYQTIFDYGEYLKRFYSKNETNTRIPRLAEYYKNYHKFFCKPFFRDFSKCELLHNCQDNKAEIFYKKNLKNSKDNDISTTKKNESESDSLSSLDNITDNKFIFTKKTKKIIDQNLDSNCLTITLNSNTDNKNISGGELISTRNANDSFEKIVYNLIHYKKNKKSNNRQNGNKINKNVKNKIKDNKKLNGNKTIKINAYFNTKNKSNISNNYNNTSPNFQNKKSLYSLLQSKYTNNNFIKQNNFFPKRNNLYSPINRNKQNNIIPTTKFQNFKNNCCIKVSSNGLHYQRNKMYNYSQHSESNNNNFSGALSSNTRNFYNESKTIQKANTPKLNHFLTMNNNNNNINKLTKKKEKSKTFENLNNEIIKNIPLIKYGLSKNMQINKKINKNSVKSQKNLKKIQNSQKSPVKFPKTKVVTSENLLKHRQIIASNVYENYKKNNTNCNNLYSSPRKSNNKTKKVILSKNKSQQPIGKNKPKINKYNRINNLNINFNNVIFETQYNIGHNSDLNSIYNSYNIITSKNLFFNNNKVNFSEIEKNGMNKNVYIMNLKNMYSISRNKINHLGENTITQDNFLSSPKLNTKYLSQNNQNELKKYTVFNTGVNESGTISNDNNLKGKSFNRLPINVNRNSNLMAKKSLKNKQINLSDKLAE